LQEFYKFTLFPPEKAAQLYLFPFLHPHNRKSQVYFGNISTTNDTIANTNPIISINSTQFPHFSWNGAVEAVLEPGDMLYIPPYWFHHVETLEMSIAINLFSDSFTSQYLDRMVSRKLPFEHRTMMLSEAEKEILALRFLKHFFRVAPQVPIAPSLEHNHGNNDKRNNNSNSVNLIAALLERSYWSVPAAPTTKGQQQQQQPCATSSSKKEEEGPEDEDKEAIGALVELLQRIPREIRFIAAQNFVEEVARWAVGAANVKDFLLCCVERFS